MPASRRRRGGRQGSPGTAETFSRVRPGQGSMGRIQATARAARGCLNRLSWPRPPSMPTASPGCWRSAARSSRELDVEAVLQRLLDTARELTGARYAALGVLDAERKQLERFVTSGVDDATHRAIGDLPRGRGVLGVLIANPRPLRLTDVGAHPRSYGFPAGHPPMTTFLGVPVVIDGEACGNLYLTEKADGAVRRGRRAGGRRPGGLGGGRDRQRAALTSGTTRPGRGPRAHRRGARGDHRDRAGGGARHRPRPRARADRPSAAARSSPRARWSSLLADGGELVRRRQRRRGPGRACPGRTTTRDGTRRGRRAAVRRRRALGDAPTAAVDVTGLGRHRRRRPRWWCRLVVPRRFATRRSGARRPSIA